MSARREKEALKIILIFFLSCYISFCRENEYEQRKDILSVHSLVFVSKTVHSSILGRGKIFLLSTLSKLVLRLIQSPVQWVPGGAVSPGVKLITHLRLMLKIRESIHPLAHSS
jgi:hypothetical protein